MKPNLYLALVHYPVVNKNGEIVAAAVTNLDLHDIARLARTYGVSAFYVITPLDDQRKLTRRIISHWVEGGGADYNPARGEALSIVRVKKTHGEMIEEITARGQGTPKTVVTSARKAPDSLTYGRLRCLLHRGGPYVLTFGTAWGLSGEYARAADYQLDPITGGTNYNHLSVRSAASIIVDRLLGGSCEQHQHTDMVE
ncbi:RNA methyltransferase [Desulfococcus sp.]|uniref:RNA methyltransferase n=1 Tax=Desulfococcus sp. TaxID=2025834 RepID=UPI003594401B